MIMRTEDDDYWEGPPCPVCGYKFNCEVCKAEAAYNEYLDERIARLGIVLAFLPDEMECYDCGRNLPKSITQVGSLGMHYMMRRVVGEGPVIEAHRDPTSTYRLVCGHYAM